MIGCEQVCQALNDNAQEIAALRQQLDEQALGGSLDCIIRTVMEQIAYGELPKVTTGKMVRQCLFCGEQQCTDEEAER